MRFTGRRLLLGLGGVLAVVALALFLLVQSAGRVLKSELERRLGKGFSVSRIDLAWGRVEARGVKMSREGDVLASAEAVTLKADFFGLVRGKDWIPVSAVSMEKPFLRLEMDRSGKLILPEIPAAGQRGAAGGGAGRHVRFNRIEVRGGEILYLDGKISSPAHPTRLTDVECTLNDIAVPPDNAWTDCSLTARIPGKAATGTLTWKGRTTFLNKDTEGTLTLKDLDITAMKPYYHRKGDTEVSGGTLSANMEVRIKDRLIRAPGRAVLKDLRFRSGQDIGDTFLGVPRALVLDLLKSGNNEISLDFIIEGSLDDPKFNLREALMKRLGVDLAQRLGLSVLGAGQPAVSGGVRGLKEVGRGLNRLLGR